MSSRHNMVLPRLLVEEPVDIELPPQRSLKWTLAPANGARKLYLQLSLLTAPAHEVIFACFNAEQFRSFPRATPSWAQQTSYLDHELNLDAELGPWTLTITNPTNIPLKLRGRMASGSI